MKKWFLLVLAVILLLVPFSALADGECYVQVFNASSTDAYEYDSSSKLLTIKASGLTVKGVNDSSAMQVNKILVDISSASLSAGAPFQLTLDGVQLAVDGLGLDIVGHPSTPVTLHILGKTSIESSTQPALYYEKPVSHETIQPLTITTDDSASLTLKSEKNGSAALYSEGSVIIAGDNVTITGKEIPGSSRQYGPHAVYIIGDLTISGSHVTLTGGNATSNDYEVFGGYAAKSSGDIFISGSHVTLTGGNATSNGSDSDATSGPAAYCEKGDITISGNDVTLKSGNANGEDDVKSAPAARVTAGNIIISGSRVTLTGGAATSKNSSYSGEAAYIEKGGDITISGSDIDLFSGDASGDSYARNTYALYTSKGNIIIRGNDVNLTGGDVNGSVTATLFDILHCLEGDVLISGSRVQFQQGDVSGQMGSIFPAITTYSGDITINGDSVHVFSGKVPSEYKASVWYSAVRTLSGDIEISGYDFFADSGSLGVPAIAWKDGFTFTLGVPALQSQDEQNWVEVNMSNPESTMRYFLTASRPVPFVDSVPAHSAPATGDGAAPVLWLCLLLASGAALVLFTRRAKRA